MNRNLQTIQWLRGIAALLVTLVHAANEVNQIFNTSPITIPHNFVLGVDLFFIISGFIMVYTTRKYKKGWKSSLLFIKNRIVRVVPIYWLYSTLAIISVTLLSQFMSNPAFDIIHIFKSLLFIPSYYPGSESIQPILRVGWTLNYEMYFYVLFSLSLFFTNRYRVELTSIFFLFILLSSLSSQGVLAKFYSNNIILEFILGMLIAKIFASPKLNRALTGYRSAIFFAATSLVSYYILVGENDVNSLNYRGLQFGIPAAALFMSFLALDTILLKINTGKNIVIRILSSLGNSSYTLYLAHLFIIVGINVIMKKLFLVDVEYAWPYFILVVLFTTLSSYILYFYIERTTVSALK